MIWIVAEKALAKVQCLPKSTAVVASVNVDIQFDEIPFNFA